MHEQRGYPNFYLELDDASSSKPVLRCYGKREISVKGHDDVILIGEMREHVTFQWHGGKEKRESNLIGITAGYGRTVRKMESRTFSVAVLLPKSNDPKAIDDFIHISQGTVYFALPTACLEMLGYDL